MVGLFPWHAGLFWLEVPAGKGELAACRRAGGTIEEVRDGAVGRGGVPILSREAKAEDEAFPREGGYRRGARDERKGVSER